MSARAIEGRSAASPPVPFLVLALLLSGALTGLLAGAFGVGGGTVIVPVLYDAFGVLGVPDDARMPLCVGTSLAIILPTSVRSFQAHRAKGAVDEAVLRVWAAPVVIGVLVGSGLARFAPPGLFKAVFVAIAGFSGARLLSGSELRLADDLPGKTGLRAIGAVIGLLSSLMGIGGGQLGNLALMGYGRPIRAAVATSSGLGVLISVPGALGYVVAGWPVAAAHPDVVLLQPPYALGYVSLLGAALFVPTSILTAPLGARIAHSVAPRHLERAFGVFLLLVAARFLFDLLR